MEQSIELRCWQITLRIWGIEQRELARRCGYSEEHMSRLFGGKRRLTPKVRERMADALRRILLDPQAVV